MILSYKTLPIKAKKPPILIAVILLAVVMGAGCVSNENSEHEGEITVQAADRLALIDLAVSMEKDLRQFTERFELVDMSQDFYRELGAFQPPENDSQGLFIEYVRARAARLLKESLVLGKVAAKKSSLPEVRNSVLRDFLRKEGEFFLALSQHQPSSQSVMEDRLQAYTLVAEHQRILRNLEAARQYYRLALDTAENLNDLDERNEELIYTQSVLQQKLATIEQSVGNYDAALQHAENSLKDIEKLIELNTDGNMLYLRRLSSINLSLGSINHLKGDYFVSMGFYNAALENTHFLIENNGESIDLLRDLGVAYKQYADTVVHIDGVEAALPIFDLAIETREKIVESGAKVNERDVNNLAQSLVLSGDAHLRLDDFEQAKIQYKKALKIRGGIVKKYSDHPESQYNYAVIFGRFSRVAKEEEKYDEAKFYLEKKITASRRAVALNQAEPKYTTDLLFANLSLAEVERFRENVESSKKYLDRSLAMSSILLEHESDNSDFQRALALTLEHLGGIHSELGDVVAAERYYNDALDQLESLNVQGILAERNKKFIPRIKNALVALN